MVAFTFICKKSDDGWTASRYSEEEGELTAEAADTYALQQTLYNLALENSAGGGVQVHFSTTSPSTAIYQIIVGGAAFSGGGGGGGGGGAAAGGAAASGAAEEKEEEKEEEEEEDDDMGFSLFD